MSNRPRQDNHTKISRRSTLAATGIGLIGLAGGATTLAQAQDANKQTSIQFITDTGPTPGEALSEFKRPATGGNDPLVRVKNPPAEADGVSLRDRATEQEIMRAYNQTLDSTVEINSSGSITYSSKTDKQDAKEDIEDNIRDSVVLELIEPLDAETDLDEFDKLDELDDLDGQFDLSIAGEQTVEFVGGTDVELVFIDEELDQIGEFTELVTIGRSTPSEDEDTEPQAEITFTDQQSDGESVMIDKIILGDTVEDTAGFIEDADGNELAGNESSVLEVTESITDLEVPLQNTITESQELTVFLSELNGPLLDEDSAFISINQDSTSQESETTDPENNQDAMETTPNNNMTVSSSTASAEASKRDLIIPGDGLASTDVDNRVIITAVSAALSFFSMGYTFFGGDDD